MRLTRSRLATLRLRAGYSTAQAGADALGISRAHLLNIERGATGPSEALLARMAATYKVALEVVATAVARARYEMAERVMESQREAL